MFPSLWAKDMQEKCLDENDEEAALVYYEIAKIWISRGL